MREQRTAGFELNGVTPARGSGFVLMTRLPDAMAPCGCAFAGAAVPSSQTNAMPHAHAPTKPRPFAAPRKSWGSDSVDPQALCGGLRAPFGAGLRCESGEAQHFMRAGPLRCIERSESGMRSASCRSFQTRTS